MPQPQTGPAVLWGGELNELLPVTCVTLAAVNDSVSAQSQWPVVL